MKADNSTLVPPQFRPPSQSDKPVTIPSKNEVINGSISDKIYEQNYVFNQNKKLSSSIPTQPIINELLPKSSSIEVPKKVITPGDGRSRKPKPPSIFATGNSPLPLTPNNTPLRNNAMSNIPTNTSNQQYNGQSNINTFKPLHPLVSFGFRGELLTMKPYNNCNGSIVIRPLYTLLNMNREVSNELYFPGPLNINTKVEDVLSYIDMEINSCPPTSSWKVLWITLKYLLKNCGEIDLLRNPPMELLNILHSQEANNIQKKYVIPHVSEEQGQQALNVIESLLRNGKITEALNIAIKNDLWSHALIISSAGGANGFSNVVKQFTQKTCPEDSLLPSLYSNFSNSLKNQRNTDISNWKELLYSILSTNSVNYMKNMQELGDSLLLHNDFPAAHACYCVYNYIVVN